MGMKASRGMSMAELVALALLRGVEVKLYDSRASLAARINAAPSADRRQA